MLIQLGDRGPAVTKIQRELLVTVTGVYDAATQSAVSAYQTSAGLTATGIVDLTTWWALFPDDAQLVAGVEIAGTFTSTSTAKIPTTKAVAEYVAAHGGGGGGGGIPTSLATAADQGLYSTAANTWAVFSLTSAWRTFLSTVKAVWTEATGVLSVWGLQIDTAPSVTPTPAVAQLQYDDTLGTITFLGKGGNVTIPIGAAELVRVKNDDVSSFTAGTVVYLSGSDGINTLAKLALASTEARSATTIGVVAETIAPNNHGWVMISGMIRNIDTSALTAGSLVWLSASVAGGMTATQPVAPNHGVQLGLCVRQSATVGAILLSMQNGYELNELHNVRISSPATGDLLTYDGTIPSWKNTATIAQSQVTNLTTDLAAKVAKAGDSMTGALSITNAAVDTLLTVTSKGIGELPIKVRTANGNQAEAGAQAGMDFGFNTSYRVTFATAATTGVGSPFDGSAYFYVAGMPSGLRFISDLITRPIEFWNGPTTLVARCYNGAFQVGSATTATSSSVAGLLYSGKAATTVQLRLGDDGGYCWSMGRDNVSTGDFVLTATSNAGANYFAETIRILWASGVVKTAVGLQVGDLVANRLTFSTTSGRLASSANLTYTDSTAALGLSLTQSARTALTVTNSSANAAGEAGVATTTGAGTVFYGTGSSASSKVAGGMIYTADAIPVTVWTNGLRRVTVTGADGNVGIGVASGTAYLHIKAGTATASTAPLKINSGTVMATPESGAVEYDGTDWYLSNSTPARRTVAYLATVTTSSTPVTVPAIGGHVRVVGTAGAKTVTLPATSGVKAGTRVTIKDAAGNAASGTITVNAASTETIDGAASATITTNYGVLRLIYSGSTGRWETC